MFLLKLKKLLCFILILCFAIFTVSCKDSTAKDNGDNNDTPIETPEGEQNDQNNYEYVYYGSYPFSLVTDNQTKNNLYNLLGDLPTESNLNGWTDNEYYVLGIKASFSFYKDLSLDGIKYRAVYFTKYRPYSSTLESKESLSFQDDNGYFINTVYYFKYEPLKWRVLSSNNGEKILLCEYVVDSQAFQPDFYKNTQQTNELKPNFYYTTANNAPFATFACSYEYSYLRNYLNGTFYNTAFSSLEKENILLTTIKNDYNSAGSGIDNLFTATDTEDYIFAPSVSDIRNSKYGFLLDKVKDPLRMQGYTDYAKSQGAYNGVNGNHKWWLRSFAHYIDKYSIMAQTITNVGDIQNYHYIHYTIMGVVPMMIISE